MVPNTPPLRAVAFSCALAVTVVAMLAGAHPVRAATGAAARYEAVAATTPPAFSTDFDVAPWPSALVVDGLQNLTTRTPATRFPTEARVLFGAHDVYVAIRCE